MKPDAAAISIERLTRDFGPLRALSELSMVIPRGHTAAWRPPASLPSVLFMERFGDHAMAIRRAGTRE